jgi:FkbM family methyltransferase
MPFSYAQNAEDVLLWRCFRDKPQGLYIDVGASSPITDSVTQVFYERGWSGVNLEPLPERAAELTRLRPRDHTVCAAAGAVTGSASFKRQRGMGGLSALQEQVDPDVARYMAEAWLIDTRVIPLSEVLGALNIEDIDFLKIDVEGSEADVLAGLDLSRWRPAVIVIEATRPMTTVPSHGGWEPGLLTQGYRTVWFDGLNRFYLADEHADLSQHFATPPNVHDAMPRFGALGPALRNPGHPDHRFALHLASLLLSAPGIETDAYLEQVMRKDLPPAQFDRPVDSAAITEIVGIVFGQRRQPETIAKIEFRRAHRC